MADLTSITLRKYQKATLNLIEPVKLLKFYDSKAKYLNEIDFAESVETVFTLLDLISDRSKVKQYM